MILQIVLIILGFTLLVKGADLLVNGASDIAKKFKIPEMVIALTIVSIGTSLPELIVSLDSAIKGYSDIAIGNIVGSNIVNLLFILGLCAIITPLEFKKPTKFIENPICLLVTGLLFIMANTGNEITRTEGIILLTGAVFFLLYNLYMARNSKEIDKTYLEESKKKELKKINVWKCILYILSGIVILKIGGQLVVDNAVLIAKTFGLSEKLIGITIVAVGTSLPELVTSVSAALKGEKDMAIGNILGSNIFNILLIIGVSSVISPITYSLSYNKDVMLLMIVTLLFCLYPFTGKKDTMTKRNGIIFVLIYIGYIITNII
ncbi:MAG: calcium/sodium antiporter [Bacilli bacterium]